MYPTSHANTDSRGPNSANFATAIKTYVDELQKLATDERNQIVERNRELDEGMFAATSDPRKPYVPPSKEAVPPFLNFAPLQNGLDALQRSTERYGAALRKAQPNGGAARTSLASVNAKIIQSERAMTLPDGLPNRPWFRHQIYAPGLYTGYGVKTIPGVREAIEQKQWKQAEEQMVRAGQVLQSEAKVIDEAAAALESAGK